MFFFINPVEYQKLLFLWAAVCEIVGVIFFYDPFNNYLLTGNYMVYGFDVMLPAFAGSIIMAFFYKRKIHLIYACAAFMLLLFGNKGALLTAIVLGISVYILVDGNIRKGRLLFVFSILYLSYLFRVQIFQKILFFFHSRGLNSYSLNTLYKIIDGQGGSVNSDRINLIRRGKRLFFQNPILGHGIGYYEEQAGFYVHNILWDILVMAGLIGMVLFIALFLRSLFCFRSYTKYQKNFYLIMMVMWIVPLMTSMTFWHWIPFWLYWTGYIFQHHTSNNYLKGEYNNG
ncbi:MAG: O-antigen ligase family protein [Lachnospiraceae bacterium]|nr:O-antigen ligase family protein [Lachnospiraceae bacterium]